MEEAGIPEAPCGEVCIRHCRERGLFRLSHWHLRFNLSSQQNISHTIRHDCQALVVTLDLRLISWLKVAWSCCQTIHSINCVFQEYRSHEWKQEGSFHEPFLWLLSIHSSLSLPDKEWTFPPLSYKLWLKNTFILWRSYFIVTNYEFLKGRTMSSCSTSMSINTQRVWNKCWIL